jgi:hypothetical protein
VVFEDDQYYARAWLRFLFDGGAESVGKRVALVETDRAKYALAPMHNAGFAALFSRVTLQVAKIHAGFLTRTGAVRRCVV